MCWTRIESTTTDLAFINLRYYTSIPANRMINIYECFILSDWQTNDRSKLLSINSFYPLLHSRGEMEVTIYMWSSRGAGAQSVTVKSTGCGFDPHPRKINIYLHLYFHFIALVSRLNAALSSATQHTMPLELGGKWGTECLNARFPLSTLLCAGYSVKLISF